MKEAYSSQNKSVKTVHVLTENKFQSQGKVNLLFVYLMGLFLVLAFTSCEDDEEKKEELKMANFTLTIENVFEAKSYFMAGATDGIAPGSSYSFSFNAGAGHYLSFANMLAQSNDLFYGFQDMGLALYMEDGSAMTGNVTSKVYLWDAGTEVNQSPGEGADQAPRQAVANTGTAENGMVKMISDVNDGFTYPAVTDIIKVMIDHDGGSMFTVTIYNMSNTASLSGPLAPGVFVIHGNDVQLFTENMAAGSGLEMLAEDGNNTMLKDHLMMNAGLVSPFAPGVFAVFTGMNPIFEKGAMASSALEALAEDGNPGLFSFGDLTNVSASGVFNTPMSASAPAPILPGEKYETSFTAMEGDMLSFASMLVQSNDAFIAAEEIDLFSDGVAMTGDITMYVKLWDAKTEMNEYPGAGMYQAPRQSAANMGMEESGSVDLLNDGYMYPEINTMIKVSLSTN